MRTSFFQNLLIGLCLVSAVPHLLEAQQENAAIRWWEAYSGDEVNGTSVLGYWKFDGEGAAFLADSSAQKHAARLQGAKPNASGKFGGCLESGVGFPIADASHSIHVAKNPVLSPAGPFTVEMWLRPYPDDAFPAEVQPVLLDSKYVPTNHTGFQIFLTKAGSDGSRRFAFVLGTGSRSDTWYAPQPVRLDPEKWQHVAFTYDSRGTVAFFVDGNEVGRVLQPDAGGMAPSKYALSIGDRIGSNYNGFPGFIDEVRITSGIREFRPVALDPDVSRFAFVRMDSAAEIKAELVNQTGEVLKGAKIVIETPNQAKQELVLPELKPSARHPVQFPVNATLKPGEYTATVSVEVPGWGGGESGYHSRAEIPFVITSRPLPYRMPVVMWGLGGTKGVVEAIPTLKSIGFTHCLGLGVDYQKIWDEGADALPGTPESIREGREMLNSALENDLKIIVSAAPGRWLRTAPVGEPYRRIDRKGNHYPHEDISGLFQPVQDFCFQTGAALGRAYGDLPAFDAALLHTEVRGESQVSFHPEEIAAYQKASGAEIPAEVTIKNGVEYAKQKDFPANRVIADDNPILKYLAWFWQKGDGWNDLSSRLNEGFKSQVKRKDFWTFYDPAVRVPSISGSGGNVDVLAHWTYSYPDPVRIGLCTDELFEMARASGQKQDVMKMTQLIWYRSQTAPEKVSAADPSPWVDQDPDAAYITIAPMHLREALWWKLSRPIQGIMYHGWGSLVKTDSPGSYRYTNPNTRYELQRLVSDVVEPLGPALMQIPDAESDVVFLESFTSQMFARRGTYGWNQGWAGDLYHVLLYAQLQPRVLYEERLLTGGLDGAKVLVLADCDVLTASVVKRIQEFQASGGLVIGDGEVCPAITPDHVIARFSRTKKAAEDRALIQETAKSLRAWLDPKYKRSVDSSNPDVVTRRRVSGTTDYVFAVNDHRAYGTYVGTYGMVMEDGLPSDTVIQAKDGHVYELPTGREIPREKGTSGSIPLALGPCEGRILMITDRPIEKVTVSLPESAERSKLAEIAISITDGKTPIDAVIPVQVEIIDPEGSHGEFSGFYGAAGGQLTIPITFAPNDRTGVWEVRVTELASRKSGAGYVRLR